MAKNGQILNLNGQNFAISEFSQHIECDFFEREPSEQLPYKKLGRFIVAFGSYRPKTSTNGQILTTNGQILAISEFSRHIHYDFLKEDPKGSLHTKLWKFISAFGRYRPKTLKNGYFGQKWPNFYHFLPFLGSKIFTTKKFLVSIEVVWRPNLTQKIRKKYQTVKAVGRTHIREWIYRFLQESKDIWGIKKTQYDWFPGKSQNSKKFHTKN